MPRYRIKNKLVNAKFLHKCPFYDLQCKLSIVRPALCLFFKGLSTLAALFYAESLQATMFVSLSQEIEFKPFFLLI